MAMFNYWIQSSLPNFDTKIMEIQAFKIMKDATPYLWKGMRESLYSMVFNHFMWVVNYLFISLLIW